MSALILYQRALFSALLPPTRLPSLLVGQSLVLVLLDFTKEHLGSLDTACVLRRDLCIWVSSSVCLVSRYVLDQLSEEHLQIMSAGDGASGCALLPGLAH